MKKYVLYNSDNNGDFEDAANALYVVYDNISLVNLKSINDYAKFFEKLSADDEVILCGNDSILSQFVNRTHEIPMKNELYFFRLEEIMILFAIWVMNQKKNQYSL